MQTYRIQWIIEIDAETPREAAERALQIQRDANSLADHFTVTDEAGKETVEVNVNEEARQFRCNACDIRYSDPDSPAGYCTQCDKEARQQ